MASRTSAPKPASRYNGLAREQLTVQPGRSWCCNLLLQGEVRPDGQREPLPTLGILIGTRLDNRASRGIARQLEVSEPKMMRPAVNSFNNRKGRSLQLVLQPTRDQTAEHRIAGLIAVKGKAGNVRLAPPRRHGPVHGLDDVSAN